RYRCAALRSRQPSPRARAEEALDLSRRRVAVGDLERLVDRTNADRELLVADRQRRRDEEHVPPAEDVDVALEQRGLESVRERTRRAVPALEHLLGPAVLHKLDPGEEAAPANLADGGMAISYSAQLREKLLPHPR